MNVKVINRNDFPITDRFDGVPYVFPPNTPVSIPIDAAHHIFGWHQGVDMMLVQRHVQKRLGWNTPDMEKDGRASRFFENLEIAPILYRMVEVEVDAEGEVVSPSDTSPKPRAPKTNKLMEAANVGA